MKIYSNEFIELAQYTVVYCVWHVFWGAWGAEVLEQNMNKGISYPAQGESVFVTYMQHLVYYFNILFIYFIILLVYYFISCY